MKIHLLALVALAGPALAIDIPVGPGQSIQTAIDAAVDGDRVLVSPGTYFEQLDFLGKAIEVVGLQGADVTILDANFAGSAVTFAGAEGPASILRGLTVTGGAGNPVGSGIIAGVGATPTIEDCIIRNNSGRFGGGVHGSPILLRCEIRNNTSSLTHGGGVYGAPQMDSCVIADNTSTSAYGGGLYLVGGSVVMRDCVVTGNRAVLAGSRSGGIHVDSTVNAQIERCVIAGNLATGGVFAGLGGGVFVEAAGTTLTHCTVTGNQLTGSSISGGGVYGPAVITNSIVWGNDDVDVVNAGTVSYSDVEGGAVGIGNIDLDPLFADAAGGDWSLTAGSPCIDAGDPASPLDPDGTRADMGAIPFDSGPVRYCSGKVNSVGCVPFVQFTGAPSASNPSAFQISAHDAVPNEAGILIYSFSKSNLDFHGGKLCVKTPFFRTAAKAAKQAGAPPCSGVLTRDFNAIIQSGTNPGLTVGARAFAQWRQRDPADPAGFGDSLTDALRFTILP